MKSLLLFCSVFVLLQSASKATALTNEEFFILVRPYVTNITEYGIDEDDSEALGANDVITLPGGPDDEVDFGYLLSRIGLLYEIKDDVPDAMESLAKHNHILGDQRLNHTVRHDSCQCCLTHDFSVHLIKKFHFHLHACLTVAYLRSNIGFELTFTINGHRLYHNEVSLKNPPPLCFGVPGLSSFARVCLELYNINLHTKSLCARLTGVLDLKVKKFKVHLKLGCFRIPIMEKDAFLTMMNDPGFLQSLPIDYDVANDVKSRRLHLVDIIRGFRKTSDDLKIFATNR